MNQADAHAPPRPSLRARTAALVETAFRKAATAAKRLRHAGRRTYPVDGLEIAAPSPLVSVSLRQMLEDGSYELEERRAVRSHLVPSLPVVEFGAGLGVVACLANRLLDDPARHVAVEMNPRLLDTLRENRDRNGARFEVLHGALWYGADPPHVDVGIDYCGGRALGSGGVPVPALRLAELLRERGWTRVNLLLDVEGQEHRMLDEELATVRENVAVLIVEVHPFGAMAEQAGRTLDTLARAGFAKHFVYGMNHVFVRDGLDADATSRTVGTPA